MTARQVEAIASTLHRREAGRRLIDLSIARGEIESLQQMHQQWLEIVHPTKSIRTAEEAALRMADVATAIGDTKSAARLQNEARVERVLAAVRVAKAAQA